MDERENELWRERNRELLRTGREHLAAGRNWEAYFCMLGHIIEEAARLEWLSGRQRIGGTTPDP